MYNHHGGTFSCGGTRWDVYCKVAEHYGWVPRGPRWNKEGYLQHSDIDASNLGEALDLALAAEDLRSILECAWGAEYFDDDDFEVDVYCLSELRAFCRGGEFWISK